MSMMLPDDVWLRSCWSKMQRVRPPIRALAHCAAFIYKIDWPLMRSNAGQLRNYRAYLFVYF